ncbi:hypothetical protein LTS08_003304 [Lithohypha guttulata]|uniref:uncharacterized protein n=1 Tax=Lithohypha guttulata TaxID=1690604 RepID=UPI002DDEE859|nr:hypothetical protein LTR51_000039 [Lithohypha guttulata]KAK5103882.1 hypothetical protein LTS08_003304 [Lithohypha guttulata]
MAQKSAKSLAVKNSQRLKQTHLITLAIHLLFLLLAFTLRRSLTLKPYLLLSAPALGLEYWLDSIARPQYNTDGGLRKAGEDLDARGLTEFFWDIIYWTWINLIAVVLFGNRAWWAYLIVPAYAIYGAFTTAKGVKGMFGGMAGGAAEGDTAAPAQSKRQQKMESRGGQKVRYR